MADDLSLTSSPLILSTMTRVMPILIQQIEPDACSLILIIPNHSPQGLLQPRSTVEFLPIMIETIASDRFMNFPL